VLHQLTTSQTVGGKHVLDPLSTSYWSSLVAFSLHPTAGPDSDALKTSLCHNISLVGATGILTLLFLIAPCVRIALLLGSLSGFVRYICVCLFVCCLVG